MGGCFIEVFHLYVSLKLVCIVIQVCVFFFSFKCVTFISVRLICVMSVSVCCTCRVPELGVIGDRVRVGVYVVFVWVEYRIGGGVQ